MRHQVCLHGQMSREEDDACERLARVKAYGLASSSPALRCWLTVAVAALAALPLALGCWRGFQLWGLIRDDELVQKAQASGELHTHSPKKSLKAPLLGDAADKWPQHDAITEEALLDAALTPDAAKTSRELFSQYKDKIIEYRMITFEELKLGRKIGKGASGAVFAAVWRGQKCAVKRLNNMLEPPAEEFCGLGFAALPAAPGEGEGSGAHVINRELEAEVGMLSKLRHPNIVLFIGLSFKDEDCFVVTEHCTRGNLLTVLRAPSIELPQPTRRRMALDTARQQTLLHASPCLFSAFQYLLERA